jgi:hypothetical protein
MDNLGAILGPLLGIILVGAVGVRGAILLSIIPGLLAVGAIVYAIRAARLPKTGKGQPIRIQVRPVLRGELGRLLRAVGAFELGNIAATLLILRATDLLGPEHGADRAAQIALASTPPTTSPPPLSASRPATTATAAAPSRSSSPAPSPLASPTRSLHSPVPASSSWPSVSSWPASASAALRRPNTRPSQHWHANAFAGRRSGCSPPPKASATSPPARSPDCSGPSSHLPRHSPTPPPGCSSRSSPSPPQARHASTDAPRAGSSRR